MYEQDEGEVSSTVAGPDGRDSRAALLEAAVACIGELGWGHVRTREVARRAGVNPGLVNYYFGSKDDLLLAAAEAAVRQELGAATEALAAAPDLEAGLAGVLGVLAEVDPDSGDASVLAEITVHATRDPRLRAVSSELLADFRDGVARLVRASQDRGALPADQDADATAAVVAALLDGLLLHALVDPSLDLARVTAALTAGMSLGGPPTPGPTAPEEDPT